MMGAVGSADLLTEAVHFLDGLFREAHKLSQKVLRKSPRLSHSTAPLPRNVLIAECHYCTYIS